MTKNKMHINRWCLNCKRRTRWRVTAKEEVIRWNCGTIMTVKVTLLLNCIKCGHQEDIEI